MKLYATVTSERATKSQGGNEWIETIFTIDRMPVARVRVHKLNNYEYAVDYFTDMREDSDFTHGIIVSPMDNSKVKGVMTRERKGEKQKGETARQQIAQQYLVDIQQERW